MIIINRNLTKLDAFEPETMSLNLEERKSTATMTLGPSAPALTVGDWLLDDEEPGAGIVWRVKTIDTQYNTNTRTVQLEHIINTLRDIIIFGEVTPADITGNSNAKNCSARDAARYALSYQNTWVLDGFDYSVSNPYSFNGDTVFAALETISSSLEDAYWSYDLTRVPFRISIRKLSSSVDSEMRMDRNIQTLKKTVDRSRMYTRFYPIGQNNLHIQGNYVSKNENIYGTICAVETDQSKKTVDELRQWANEKLSRHCEPSVTVQISGLELSEATGEPLDHFTLNTKCRVPLPEFDTTIIEKVTKLSWSDKLKEPEKVTVTLANLLEDVASIINNANSTSSKNSRSKAKKDEEDHAWFVDTEDHVGMVAEAVAGPGADQDWSRVASIFVDGEGIHQKVVRTEGELVVAQTAIEANEYKITLEAQQRISENESIRGELVVQSDQIKAEVEQRKAGDTRLSGRIEVNAQKVGMVVEEKNGQNVIKAAEICVAINDSGETEAVINASKIYLLGQTIANQITAEYIDAKISSLATLHAKDITANSIYANSNLYLPNGLSVYANGLWNVTLTGPVDNVYTLKKTTLNGTESTIGTFSRATSLSGAWSGSTYTVTASPQGNTDSVTPAIHYQEGSSETLNTNIGTNNAGVWTDHGNAVKAYLVVDGNYVKLNNLNATSGSGVKTFAQIAYPQSSYTSKTLYCTEVEPTYPGSSSNYYYFRLEGRYSFNQGSNYVMYRQSW